MRRMFVGILSVLIIGVAVAATEQLLSSKAANQSSEASYKDIDRTFTGFIFSPKGKLVKNVPVTIKGKQYSETSAFRDNFAGTIDIDGEVVDISSTRDKAAGSAEVDYQKFYLAANPSPDSVKNGILKHTTAVTISRDFTTIYGYTANITKNYGQGSFFKSDMNLKTPQDEYIQYLGEASQRVQLYVSVMKAAFQTENGGNSFIAVKEEGLEGLKDEKSRLDVLNGFKSLSRNQYWYEGVKDDKSLFEFDKDGRMIRTLNGTLLSIKVDEYKNDEAVVEADSWFGNTGAAYLKYNASYKDGQWQLKAVSKAIS